MLERVPGRVKTMTGVQTGRGKSEKPTGVSGRVLVIDDDALLRRSIRRVLVRLGYEVEEAADGKRGVKMLASWQPDIALVDVRMPGLGGFEVLARARTVSPGTDCIVVTGHGDVQVASRSLQAGAADYFEKPIRDWQRFQQVLRRAAEVSRLRRENRRLRDDEELLFGPSPQMQALRERVRHVATSSAPTLVLGERGSETDVVAHVIHLRSGRGGRFVDVACTGLPETVLETELFGFAAGAHPTAADAQVGLLEQASDGTLFLDEIGELPLILQGKLLRVLETGRFRPYGGTERPFTARIVAATNLDLNALVDSGRFRGDLLLRIDVLRVVVPPLREREGDVVTLAYRMVDELNRIEGRSVRHLPPDALHMLETWNWPGNMDELRNALRRAVVLSTGEALDAEALRGLDTASTARRIVKRTADPTADGPFGSLLDLPYADAKMRAVEWFTDAYLQHHLAATRGNITQAAERTGMARPNFSRLMRRYDIEIDRGLSEAIAHPGSAEIGKPRREPLSSR